MRHPPDGDDAPPARQRTARWAAPASTPRASAVGSSSPSPGAWARRFRGGRPPRDQLGEHPVDDRRGRLRGAAARELALRGERDAGHTCAAKPRASPTSRTRRAESGFEVGAQPLPAQAGVPVLVERSADARGRQLVHECGQALRWHERNGRLGTTGLRGRLGRRRPAEPDLGNASGGRRVEEKSWWWSRAASRLAPTDCSWCRSAPS